MSLSLHIELPDNLTTTSLLEQKSIPCLCRIMGNQLFELEFQDPLPKATGRIEGWTPELISDRVWAGGGGMYTHYCFATVSLEKSVSNFYQIKELQFFNTSLGWLTLIENHQWSEPKLNSPEEIKELDAMFPFKKGNKKRQKLMKSLEQLEKN